MNTKYGGRQRPHLEIRKWITLGGDQAAIEAPPEPPPATPALEQVKPQPRTTEAAPIKQTTTTTKGGISKITTRAVSEPTLEELLNDNIPDFGETKSSDKKPAETSQKKPLASQPQRQASQPQRQPQRSAPQSNKKRA